MVRSFRTDLDEKLKNADFARAFGAAQAKSQAALALAKARRNASMSQKTLAEWTGYSQPYIAKLESGEANPTLAKIGVIMAAMGQRVIVDVAPIAFPADTPIRPTTCIRSINYTFLPQNEERDRPTESSSYRDAETKMEVLTWPNAVSTTH